MSRRGAKTEPDLFTLPERKIEPAPLPSRPVLLPDDLVSSLRLVGGRRVGASSGSRGKRSRAPRPANTPFGARERSERRARATGPYSSSPQTGESGCYCRKGQRHPSGLPGRAEAGHHRPSVRRAAVRRPTSPAGRGQVIAALTKRTTPFGSTGKGQWGPAEPILNHKGAVSQSRRWSRFLKWRTYPVA